MADDKKDAQKNHDAFKSLIKPDLHKGRSSNVKNPRAKFSMKKVGRSRNQKGQKSY